MNASFLACNGILKERDESCMYHEIYGVGKIKLKIK
jgi:hypothetical protein